MRALTLTNVSITLKRSRQPLISDLSLVVRPGHVATILGSSGMGKSTLLAFISGHLDSAFLATGHILVGDTDVTALKPEKRRIGILFQDDLLFPHLSVGRNLAFGLASKCRGSADRKSRVESALASAGLAGFYERSPATLSGGQRARVALMRTLLSEPNALLLDEPFSKLDASLRSDIRSFVFDHARQNGLPILMVTHDKEDLAAAAGEVIRL